MANQSELLLTAMEELNLPDEFLTTVGDPDLDSRLENIVISNYDSFMRNIRSLKNSFSMKSRTLGRTKYDADDYIPIEDQIEELRAKFADFAWRQREDAFDGALSRFAERKNARSLLMQGLSYADLIKPLSWLLNGKFELDIKSKPSTMSLVREIRVELNELVSLMDRYRLSPVLLALDEVYIFNAHEYISLVSDFISRISIDKELIGNRRFIRAEISRLRKSIYKRNRR